MAAPDQPEAGLKMKKSLIVSASDVGVVAGVDVNSGVVGMFILILLRHNFRSLIIPCLYESLAIHS